MIEFANHKPRLVFEELMKGAFDQFEDTREVLRLAFEDLSETKHDVGIDEEDRAEECFSEVNFSFAISETIMEFVGVAEPEGFIGVSSDIDREFLIVESELTAENIRISDEEVEFDLFRSGIATNLFREIHDLFIAIGGLTLLVAFNENRGYPFHQSKHLSNQRNRVEKLRDDVTQLIIVGNRPVLLFPI